jgi:hypothetical protein
MDKKSILKLFYDWKIFLIVIVLYFIIEFLTTGAGGFSGFPLKTCPHWGGFDNQVSCIRINIALNLFSYYVVLIIFSIIMKLTCYFISRIIDKTQRPS